MKTRRKRSFVIHSIISIGKLSSLFDRNKGRDNLTIFFIFVSKLFLHFFFLSEGKAGIHKYQNRKHDQREQGRPLQKESNHNKDKPDVLRMTDVTVCTGCGQRVILLGFIENSPCACDDEKSGKDDQVAYNVQDVEMWIALESEQSLPQVTVVVSEPIDVREIFCQHAGKKINRQREAVHLGKECNNKRRKSPE